MVESVLLLHAISAAFAGGWLKMWDGEWPLWCICLESNWLRNAIVAAFAGECLSMEFLFKHIVEMSASLKIILCRQPIQFHDSEELLKAIPRAIRGKYLSADGLGGCIWGNESDGWSLSGCIWWKVSYSWRRVHMHLGENVCLLMDIPDTFRGKSLIFEGK